MYWYAFGARFLDVQLGRWHVIDNMVEKYYSFTPYTYAVNNPLRFLDPDGNEIVDAKGNTITYSSKTGWSKNATDDVKRIYSMMMKTKTGRKQMQKAFDSKHKITFAISDKTVEDGKKLTLGITRKKSVFNIEKHGYELKKR